jgi:hypothetical protein
MTLSELETEIKRWLPDKSSAAIMAAANFAIREIGKSGVFSQNFRSSITTTDPVSLTSVTATNGSTTVSATGIVAGMANQVIQIEGDDNWYTIATATTGSLTLSSVFAGATGSGTLTATVAYARVALPAYVLTIDRIRAQNYEPLTQLDGELATETYSTGRPDTFVPVVPVNTSEYLEVFLIPFPDADYTFIVEGRKKVALFSDSSSQSGVPEEHEDILLSGTLFYLWSAEDGEEKAAFWKQLFERGLRRGKAVNGVPVRRLGRLGAGYTGFTVTHPNEVEYSS